MFIDTNKLLAGYFEIVKKEYPEITMEQLSVICRSPFVFLKEQMKKVSLPIIRFQFFGAFVVYNKTKTRMEGVTQQLYDEGRISKEKYDKIQQLVQYNESQN